MYPQPPLSRPSARAGIMQDPATYGAIASDVAATPPKRIGRKAIVALAATLGLAAGVAALSLTPSKKTADVASLYGSTAKGGITCPDDPCAKCGEGGMTGRQRAFYSPPGQPPIPVPNCVEIKILRGPTHWSICAQVPKARCAKPLNGLTDCTDLCRKFPNAGHTTTCCKCYPAC